MYSAEIFHYYIDRLKNGCYIVMWFSYKFPNYAELISFEVQISFYKMKQRFKRRWVNLIDLFLKTIGVNVGKKNIRWYELHHFGMIFPILQGTIHISLYALVNRKVVKEAIIGVGFLAGVLVVLASVYIL